MAGSFFPELAYTEGLGGTKHCVFVNPSNIGSGSTQIYRGNGIYPVTINGRSLQFEITVYDVSHSQGYPLNYGPSEVVDSAVRVLYIPK